MVDRFYDWVSVSFWRIMLVAGSIALTGVWIILIKEFVDYVD